MKHLLSPQRHLWIIGLLVILGLSGCTLPNAGDGEDIDLLTDPSMSINQDTDKFYAGILVTLAEGTTLDTIWAEMYLASGELADSLDTDSLQAATALNDSATGGDILKADGVFAATFASPLPPGTGGTVRFVFNAMVSGDLTTVTDTLSLQNLKPVILSVTAADTLALQAVDTLHVEVSDADGLEDVRSVNFTSVKPDSTVASSGDPTPLRDNGDEIGWGDATKGDGIYSYILRVPGDALVGTYTFRFVAKDFNSNISDTTFHTLVVTP